MDDERYSMLSKIYDVTSWQQFFASYFIFQIIVDWESIACLILVQNPIQTLTKYIFKQFRNLNMKRFARCSTICTI